MRSTGAPLRRAALASALLACLAPTSPPAARDAGEGPDTLWVDAGSSVFARRGTRAEPFHRIGEALEAVRGPTWIRVASGDYRESVKIPDGVALVGEGPSRPIVRGPWLRRRRVITMRGKSSLEFLRVTGGEEGVHVDVNAHVRLVNVEIVDNHRNGIGFERVENVGGEPATVEIEDCLISGNKDGIDLESTRGVIRESRLVGNSDDGIDYDGNTDCAVLDNKIRDNGDDGIEIRLKRDTLARIEGNVITGNGEDGIEIIDTWQPKPTANHVEISDNVIRDNARYGIGAVEHASEDVKPGLQIEGIALGENRVSANGRADVAGVETRRGTALRDPAHPRGMRTPLP